MIGGNEFVIGPDSNGDKISFYCKNATSQLNTFISSALANTSLVRFISNEQATFNNYTPISNTLATLPNHLTTKNYIDNNYLTISSAISIYATKSYDNTFTGYNNVFQGGLTTKLSITFDNT
jgi:hypothetical protein